MSGGEKEIEWTDTMAELLIGSINIPSEYCSRQPVK